MSRQYADRAPVSFCDVAACFSDEEWKLLHEWQKELYKNVMKEVQQALISLGPFIANAVFSLRATEREDLCPADSQQRINHSSVTGDLTAKPPVLARKKKEDNLYLKNHHDTKGREIYDCHTIGEEEGFDSLTNEKCLRLEEASTVRLLDHLGAEVGERSSEPHSVISFRIKEEEDAYSLDHQHSLESESIVAPTGDPVFISMYSQNLEPAEETHYQTEPESEGRASGEGNGNRKREADYSVACTEEKATASNALCGKDKGRLLKSADIGTEYRNQLWSEGNQELRGENANPSEIGFINQEHATFYPETSNLERSDTYNDLWTPSLLTCQTKKNKHLRPYACPECEKCFKMKQHLTRHQRTHSGERPYHCTLCEKSFRMKHHLTGHQRTHRTGICAPNGLPHT